MEIYILILSPRRIEDYDPHGGPYHQIRTFTNQEEAHRIYKEMEAEWGHTYVVSIHHEVLSKFTVVI